jgi:alpha-tubulin suppressor-like RCC1 family protein
VATVSASGLVTAVAPGSAQITATSESVTSNVTVTVSPVPVASLTLSSISALVPRQSQILTATVKDSAGNTLQGRTVAWSTSNATIATVNDSGTVTAVAAGSAEITATAEGRSTSATVTVRDGGFVTSAGGTVTAAAVTIVVPAQTLSANVALTVDRVEEPAANARLLAGSAYRVGPDGTMFSQAAQLSISYSALPTGVVAQQLRVHRYDGSAWQPLASTVTMANSRVTASVNTTGTFALIEVPVPVASVTVAPTTAELNPGDTLQLVASVRGASGEELDDRVVNWSSSNTSVATVSTTGLVVAIAPGAPATITATSDGMSGAATITVAEPFAFASIAAGAFHTCALTTQGEAWCWGSNAGCELGASPCGNSRTSPVRVATTLRFASLALGQDYSCALTEAGAAWCWGQNESGMFGNGNTSSSLRPVAVGGGHVFESITAGYRHVCALKASGEAWCWGANNDGQLGIGDDQAAVSSPVRVSGNHTFAMLGAGSENTCGLTPEGIAWCWGENSDGESGDGTGSDVSRPVRVAGNHVFTAISVGEYHSCGVKSTGALWCWGWNESGQIGDGSALSRLVPAAVSGSDQFASVHASGWSTCALTVSGAAKCWGENFEGQLGIGSTGDRSTPVSVSGSHRFKKLNDGGLGYHVCGLTTADVWYCWGWNSDGQIGDGTFVDRRVPVVLPIPTPAVSASRAQPAPNQIRGQSAPAAPSSRHLRKSR